MNKTKTTLFFEERIGDARKFLGLDARPKSYDGHLHTAIASPAQIAKIKRAIADGVRYEVQYIKGSTMDGDTVQPGRVRVHTYDTHKVEVRQHIRSISDLVIQECLWAVDRADRLASDVANPLPPRVHERHVTTLGWKLNSLTEWLTRRVCGYVDPAFMQYPSRRRKTPSKR